MVDMRLKGLEGLSWEREALDDGWKITDVVCAVQAYEMGRRLNEHGMRLTCHLV